MKAEAPAWFVYIARCADGSLYTGVTNDVARRMRAHNAGTGGKYTRSRRPVRLVWCEKRKGKGAALSRELEIKSWSAARKRAWVAARSRTRRSRTAKASSGGRRSSA